jgi:serine/threonine protein kinase
MSDQKPSPETILAAALEIADPVARRAYLDRACGGDAALRQEVESLLDASAAAGKFLLRPAGAAQKTVVISPLSELTGTRIGHYKLLEQIGEGGFGVVWMAEQEEPVRRRVALKIIKLGMDTREVVARFDAERQALAMMDHPNIASVFDGGATDTGRPYFVMELVKGVPITDYGDANKLSTRERLELFMQVCHAVQHAHQKGVIHRDLKPSNILVTMKDDRPMPKVIDFGVAKATQARLTQKTLFTRFQQWIGTPAYMSPEQAGLGSLDVDTRSDIYSLGVLLYELLTGRTPFDTQKLLAAGYDAVMRTIREEDPPKPSARLSTLAKEELSAVAAQRGAEPAKLGRLVRGDLDWIVMKALEKDRTRRYETANAFARDVEAYLEQEPVSAAAPSAAYRARRFIGRNRLVVGFSTALALSLLAGTIFSTWQAWRANRYAREAELQRGTATNEAARALMARDQSEVNAYGSRILLAVQLWQSGDVENAEKSLDECATPLRGWEWNQLKRQFHSEILSIPPARPAPTNEPAFEQGQQGHLAFIRKDTELWVSRARYDGPATV